MLTPHKTSSPTAQGSLGNRQVIRDSRLGMATLRQCFLDNVELSRIWILNNWDSIHRTCTGSGQTKFLHEGVGQHEVPLPTRAPGSWWLLGERESVFFMSIDPGNCNYILFLMLASMDPDFFPRFSISRVVSLCDFFIVSTSTFRCWMVLFNSFTFLYVFSCNSLRHFCVSSLRVSTCLPVYLCSPVFL